MKTRQPIILSPPLATAIARGAAFVPRAKRSAFLKGVVQSLRGLRRPDPDQVASAIFLQWRLLAVVPTTAKKKASPFPFRRAA